MSDKEIYAAYINKRLKQAKMTYDEFLADVVDVLDTDTHERYLKFARRHRILILEEVRLTYEERVKWACVAICIAMTNTTYAASVAEIHRLFQEGKLQ